MTTNRRTANPSLQEPAGRVIRLLLDNGLAVVLCPTPHLSQAYAAIYSGVGSRHEALRTNGVTHVLEHMLFRGTASFPDATLLNAAAEELGGFLEGATYRDHVMFATGCHPSTISDAITILGELLQTPRYRGMAVEQAILREELLETLDGHGRMVDLDNIAHQAIFGDHGLGLPIEGNLSNLDALGIKEIEEHRRTFLVASNTVISLAGPLDVDRTLLLVKKAFGRLPFGNPPLMQAPSPPRDEPIMRYVRDASSQVDVRVSFRTGSAHDLQYPALVMLARLLADGLASRMHAELVDKRGLAYALHAGLTTYGDCGLFEFEFAVAPDRAASALKAVLDFIHSTPRFRFSSEEMARARRRYRYGIEFMRDSPPDLASWYGRSTLFGVESQMDHLGARITKLSEAEVRAAARKVFSRRGMVVAAAGELARGEWRRTQQVVEKWRGCS